MKDQLSHTTTPSKRINNNSIKHRKKLNSMAKFLFHKKNRPTDLVEGIIYDMTYLHSKLSKTKIDSPKKPGYQNYLEV